MATRPQPPLLEVASRAELRAWLAENHATSSGVRLVLGKKGNPVLALSYEDAMLEAIAFGWIDSTGRKLDENRFTLLFTPRKRGSVWAKSNKARVELLSAAGLMAPAGIAAVEAAKADGSWNALDDVDALIVPGDLAAALAAAGLAKKYEALPPSQRRMALYWIANAKRPATREKRIAATLAAVAEGHGPV